MKKLLNQIQSGAGLQAGGWFIFAYPDGTITARQDGSGLMAPTEHATLAGLKRILAFIDEN